MKKDITETLRLGVFECGVPEGYGVPLLSTSSLLEAFRNQRLDIEILRCTELAGCPNVSQLAKMLGKDRNRIKSRLYKLKSEGYVKDRFVSVRTPFNYTIQCHEWQLTNKGQRVLREGESPLLAYRSNEWSLAWNTKVRSDRYQTAGIMPSRGEPNSELNCLRTNQAATILHAFSLVQKTSRLA